jgi:hypothetical protein
LKSSNFIIVDAELEAVQKALAGTRKSFTSIQKQALGIIARKGVQKVRQEIKSSIQNKERSTGELQKAYAFRVKKNGSEANLYPRGASGSKIFPKAYVQNYGYAGATVKSPSWNIKPKAFVENTESYLNENNFDSELSKMVNKVLDKYWG